MLSIPISEIVIKLLKIMILELDLYLILILCHFFWSLGILFIMLCYLSQIWNILLLILGEIVVLLTLWEFFLGIFYVFL